MIHSAHADWNVSARAHAPLKSYAAAALRAATGSVPAQELVVDAPPAAEIEAVKKANAQSATKRLQIGIDRRIDDMPQAKASAVRWQRVAGGFVAHWRVISPGAQALRVALDLAGADVELRFSATGNATVYGPFTAADFEGRSDYWSPVIDGDRMTIEAFVAGEALPGAAPSLERVSHLFVHPADPKAESLAKTGESGTCEIDLVCRAGTDPALADVGKAVARMVFSISGGSALCTGTLLNPTGAQVPYFYTAHHCISTAAEASSLTTWWFFDRSGCGSGVTSSAFTQLPGGAAYLYSNAASDGSLLRLNASPPAGAVYAAWDSSSIAASTATTAVHHPAGDWKKVSLGTATGFGSPGVGYGSFIVSAWSSGVTEGGSSGSGLFTLATSPVREYRLRGGLWGGPSSCGAVSSDRFDYYSRFDQVYPSIAQYLNPSTPPPSYTLTVSRTGAGTGTVTSSPAGISCGSTCSAAFAGQTAVTLLAQPASGSVFSGWSGACAGAGSCVVTLDAAKSVTASFALDAPPALALSTTSLDFGGVLVGTASVPMAVTLSNTGGGIVSFTGFSVGAGFSQSNACTSLAAGASCTVSVTFRPSVAGSLTGSLAISSNLSTRAVSLAGRGQASLVAHFYQTVLRRAPDDAGRAYWDGEALRLAALGANVNETWFAMAQSFFASAEYAAFGRSDDGYVSDLYRTFFDRDPDAGGLGYWTGLLAQRMPREVVMAAFMFSPEFAAFTRNLYGSAPARAEVDTVMDFYRGLLARLADSAGFGYWVGQFRNAQCQGSFAVNLGVEQVSSTFATSPEYAARGRGTAQYVGDLYNAFLRRGGDLDGVLFWIGQIDSGARTREQVRQAFLASAEFQARVAAIVAQGCLPGP